jgi:hypothetical protein
MSDYNNLVNASILTPTTTLDLGSESNRYNNIFLNGNIAIGGATITPSNAVIPRISSISYTGDDAAADPAGGQTVSLNGSGFLSGASVYINGSPISVIIVTSSTLITFVAPAKLAGNYSLVLVNPDGAGATFVPGIQYSGIPAWSTSAGTLGSVYEMSSISNILSATSDSAVSYSVVLGALPAGITLHTGNGLVSGTAPAVSGATTYNFTINAKDGEDQDTNRNFSYTVNPDAITWSSPANGATLSGSPGTAFSQSLSATSATGNSITYTANALPVGLSISGSTITGTPSSNSSITTLLTATSATTNKTSTRTIIWSIVVSTVNIEYLIIAPGGTGSWGGGGAGGFIEGTASYSTGTTLSVAFDESLAHSGGGVTFGSLKAIKGGGEGNDGGSGGGGSVNSSWTGAPKITGPTNGLALQPSSSSGGYGYNGGAGISNGQTGYAGGGGGGAGGPGTASTTNQGGAGGAGRQSSITGTATWYCGGGGGGSNGTTPPGGGGSSYGGGGSWTASPAYTAGPGILILVYLNSFPSLNISGIGYSINTTARPGYRMYTFLTGSGSISIPSFQAPQNTVAPTVTGVLATGNSLKCSTGTWASADFPLTLQWKRNGANIAAATGTTYTVQAQDVGATITCTVTQTNIAGTLSVDTVGILEPVIPTVAISYLLVAGGGGSGARGGKAGGGGGGGVVRGDVTVTAESITVTVGAAGAGGSGTSSGSNGGNSNITSSGIGYTIQANGGGGGGDGAVGSAGGSGGGGGFTGRAGGASNKLTIQGATSYGNAGGAGGGDGWHQGGGGGAGGAGDFGYYGGPANSDLGRGTPGPGVFIDMGGGISGTYGAGLTGNGSAGQSGHVGLVVLRYSDTIPAASSTTGNPTITVASGYRLYQFSSSGSITF